MNWKTWALNIPNCFSEIGSPRLAFICSDKTREEYAQEFPFSMYGHLFTPEEQIAQWNVILTARRWFEASFMVAVKECKSLNEALKIIDSK